MRIRWEVWGVIVVVVVGALTVMISFPLREAIEHFLTWSVPVGMVLMLSGVYVWWQTFRPRPRPVDPAVLALSHTLLLSAVVKTVDMSPQLAWIVTLKNTGDQALEHGPVEIYCSLNGTPEEHRTGGGQVLARGADGYYRFPFNYSEREGIMIVRLETTYGVPGARPVLRQNKTVRMEFQPRGMLCTCQSVNAAYDEVAL